VSNVIRFPDPHQRSRDPDAVPLRDPANSAVVIILPDAIPPDQEKFADMLKRKSS